MFEILLQLAVLIAIGVGWRWWAPGGLDVEFVRRAITGLVFHLLLPVLILNVMWRTPLGWDALRIAFLGQLAIFSGLAIMAVLVKMAPLKPEVAGALILAAAFPNATYLGLPLLDASFGPWTHGIAIQYELFVCTPLLMTAGAVIARHYGAAAYPDHYDVRQDPPWLLLLRIPPIWAMLIAIPLSVGGVPQPDWLLGIMNRMADCVVPLMLLSIGMSLDWRVLLGEHRAWLIPVVVVQLFICPLIVWLVAPLTGMQDDLVAPTVLIAATPSMVAGILICDRYLLKSSVYAAAVTLTTVVSLLTLPLWLYAMGGV